MSRGPKCGMRQLEWFKEIQVGSIIKSKRGNLRVVRKVSRDDQERLTHVALSIQRCSWTEAPYTIKNATDIRLAGFTHVPGRIRLDREIDQILGMQIADQNYPRTLHCCDVAGVIA